MPNTFATSPNGDMVEKRASPRVGLRLEALVETLNFTRRVELVDLSTTGARIRTGQLPKVGSDLVIKFGGVDTLASVIWTDYDFCGIEFIEPISNGDVARFRLLSENAEGLAEEQLLKAAEEWAKGLAH